MKMKKITTLLSTIAVTATLLFHAPIMAEEAAAPALPGITTNSIPGWPAGPEIAATAGIVLDADTGITLYGKNTDELLFPGSTVKIMTMLLALENTQLQDEVTMTDTGVLGVTDGGYSISGRRDEVFTVEQCLYAVMLKSANDVALQLAEHVSGSVDEFVKLMNSRAEELGCTDTVFTNPTGLPDANQHTTAHDMALIMKAAMSNAAFRTIALAQSYVIPPTNQSDGSRNLTNSFKMTIPSEPMYYADCIGGKLGFTNASGETLLCAAKRDDRTLICVVLQGASDTTPVDAAAIMNYGFDSFHYMDLGHDDFDVLEGGIVLAPVTASAAAFEHTDEPTEDGKLLRTYTFAELPVGTAICNVPAEEEQIDFSISEKHLEEARANTMSDSPVPYYIIGGIGGVLFILLLILMIKVIIS